MNTIITEQYYEEQAKNATISHFFRKFKIGKALSSANFYKEKGVKPIELLRYLFELVFTNKNLYRSYTMDPKPGMSKNTVYRFLNSPVYDWCKLVFRIAMQAILTIIPLTSETRENVLIVDDTLYNRSRSKKVDMLSKVYDHTTGKYIKGFKLLTLAWSDGNTTIPLCFRHLASTSEKMTVNKLPDNMDKRTRGYRLRRMARQNPVEAMFDLLKGIDLKKLKVRYLLFDSWFAFPGVIIPASEQGADVICMLKHMHHIYYKYKGRNYELKSLYEAVPHNRRGEVIASVKVQIHKDEKTQNVKVIFLRTKNEDKWVALLSTDLGLSDEEMIRIYGKRWNIEVMFKTSKHFLHLDTESQGRSFESIYAQTAIVYLRYIMLTCEARATTDPRTCGELFYLVCDELKDMTFLEALMILLNAFLVETRNELVLTEQQIETMFYIFVNKIPCCLRIH